MSWTAPLAISFYTLQIVSYLLDNYWGITDTERNPIKLLLYTSFFPLMVSGPINRHHELGHQLFEEHRFDYKAVTHGMKRICWGLVKKIAISGRLCVIVDTMWANPQAYDGVWIWVAVVLYSFQLYTDFSGCMDVIIGVSECFGIKLAENFNAPFLSKTVQEFWRRWHITLGLWLRDYIMNPILKSDGMIKLGEKSKARFGKRRGKKVPAYISMLVLWLCMGVWHGNSWKYILGEGLWFWAVIVLGQICEPLFDKAGIKLRVRDGILWKIWQVIRTNLIFAVGMMFFRASSITDAFARIKMSVALGDSPVDVVTGVRADITNSHTTLGLTWLVWLILSMILLVVYDIYQYKGTDPIAKVSEMKLIPRWIIYFIMVSIVIASYYLGVAPFMYANF